MIGVEFEVGPTIRLHSGAILDFLNPSASDFTIEDIAHGLANVCRYAGQCDKFYSVAEHSLLVSDTAQGFEYAALLHDAAEAFIGDITRPLKQLLPEFKRIEGAIQHCIFSRFGLPLELPSEVKRADLRVLAAEQAQIMPPGTSGWAQAAGIDPAPILVRHLEPELAKSLFLEKFEQLQPGRTGSLSGRRRLRPIQPLYSFHVTT